MANPDLNNTELKPAPMEQGGLRKLRIGVTYYCICEFWALLCGSGILWFTGLVHNTALLAGLASAGVMGSGLTGTHIETWLAMISREPLINEKGEIDSNAPFERGMWYLLPPLIAFFGIFSVPARTMWVSVPTTALSLFLFGRIMYRIIGVLRFESRNAS